MENIVISTCSVTTATYIHYIHTHYIHIHTAAYTTAIYISYYLLQRNALKYRVYLKLTVYPIWMLDFQLSHKKISYILHCVLIFQCYYIKVSETVALKNMKIYVFLQIRELDIQDQGVRENWFQSGFLLVALSSPYVFT